MASRAGKTTGTARETAVRMGELADDFLASLSADQRARARLPFAREESRTRWAYTPGPRPGVPLGEMSPAQRLAALRLLASGLSSRGFATASIVMSLEAVLLEQSGWAEDELRDPLAYHVAVYGAPDERSAWGWRFEGHHLSVHYTLAEGRIVSPTPTFFGASPAETGLAGCSFLRPLSGVEDLARQLVRELEGEERKAALIADAAPPDLVTSNRPQVLDGSLPIPFSWMDRSTDPQTLREGERWLRERGLSEAEIEAVRYRSRPRGLPASRMRPGQCEILRALLSEYLDRLPEEVAQVEGGKLREEGIDEVYFAWAGGVEKRQPHYYRLQGGWFLAEYDNTQDGANHVHTVWRDPVNDFGADYLARHYARDH